MKATSHSRGRFTGEYEMKTILILLFLAHVAFAQGAQNPPQSTAIPESATTLFKTTGLDRQYEFSSRLKPSYLSGDFDGDGKPDIAVSR